MIAVSSHKEHSLSGEYARNQTAAYLSWLPVFTAIYYFGKPEDALTGPRTTFISSESKWASIAAMMLWAAQERQLVAIINADIVVTPKLSTVEWQMEKKEINAATSKRYQVQSQFMAVSEDGSAPAIVDNYGDPKITDKGLDIFIARPWLWKTLAKQCPPGYRIGHCEWDTWCLGMLMRFTHRKMADFTESKCIFHPIHEGRDRPHNADVPKMPEWLYDYAKMPLVKIKV